MTPPYGYDDDDGQVDGDSVGGAVQFQSSLAGVDHPWMREGIPPWHLWGNSLELTTLVQEAAPGIPIQPATGQLIKVSYKRPDTWNWLLSARLISGPPSSQLAAVGGVNLDIYFDLITGVGRSTVVMQKLSGAGVNNFVAGVSRSFEKYEFFWDATLATFPAGAKIWTTEVLAPNRRFVAANAVPIPNGTGNAVPPAESATFIDHIVAQDIQLSCRVFASAQPGDTAIGQPIVLEVSAQFAPVVHVRPDWYQSARTPTEQRFPGAETAGK